MADTAQDHARVVPLILAIDGPAASGKTTLAMTIPLLLDCVVIHMDELYDGWDGLAAGVAQASALVDSLRAGRNATYRRYDWSAGCYSDEVTVPSAPLVIIEGVGAGSLNERADCVVWIEAGSPERAARAEVRGDFADQWHAWSQAERDHFAVHGTREDADLRFDTSSEPG